MVTICASLNLLYPPFRSQLENAINICKTSGFDIYIFETWRSPERQDKLHQATVTSPVWVTDAGAWQSWHNYGLACDLAFGGPGKWSWRGDWDGVRKIMYEQGLRLLDDKDKGHIEFDHPIRIADARQICATDDILGLWQRLEDIAKKKVN